MISRVVLGGLASAVILTASTSLFPDQVNKAWEPVRGSVVTDDSVRHNDRPSFRFEATPDVPNASSRSNAVRLTVGKTYEVSGWVRTENLSVKDLDRTPIAVGAALAMESTPFDVHSVSVGGTQDWTRLSFRFVATRSEDHILITVGNNGSLQGKAWFEGVTIDEASPGDNWPAAAAIRAFGPAYRYPAAGWIYLHVEGKPYERGYQHGYLMSKEIPEYLTRCAIELAGRAEERSWSSFRASANALFLRGFNNEILEEMRGIADGANAQGAQFLGRKLDLIDIVVANTTVELGELEAAMPVTPTGMEKLEFNQPGYGPKHMRASDRCSAFAATGPATRDGKMIIGHVTWWSQTLAEQTNVMLDIKPEQGHRMLIQSYPGGIESGTDWYQNDSGIVLTETTIDQTPFNVHGTPVAFRARMAIQYGGNVDEIVKQLSTGNNGLYTNEWLIGDAKNNEIAMFELGTYHTKLWRSSKDEWFGGTPGFYWGDNNAKDLTVNLELKPDPHGAPSFIPYVPGPRDLAWMNMYSTYKGRIDEQFGFKAFDSAPLVSSATVDAKLATADMANHMLVWAEMGRPNESVIPARDTNKGLYPGGYYVFSANPPAALGSQLQSEPPVRQQARKAEPLSWKDKTDQLWKGWVLPASAEDNWFVAGSAAYYRLLQSTDVEQAVETEKIRYRGLKLAPTTPINSYLTQRTEGELFLDSLRRKMGDDAFLSLLRKYFAGNTTKTVKAQSFLEMAGLKYQVPDVGDGPAYVSGDINRRLESAVIVYGTVHEAGTNRYAAEQLQSRYRDNSQRNVPIYKDFEATGPLMSHNDVIFIGRPDTNSALAAWRDKIGLDYHGAVFKIHGNTYGSERDALVYAARNPLDGTHMVLVFAGNSPLETARSLQTNEKLPATILQDGKAVEQ